MEQRRGKVLVVDDSLELLSFLEAILAETGHDVLTEHRPALVASWAREHCPDLILLDIVMPEMNGFEVCAQLKDDETTREIPVIFVSGQTDVEDKVQAFERGGVDYISKPFEPEEVLARVETHLALSILKRDLRRKNAELLQEIEERKRAEREKEELIERLTAAAAEVKRLSGFLPICASCKSIRDDQGYWNQLEAYISSRSEAQFTHGICPSCAERLYSSV